MTTCDIWVIRKCLHRERKRSHVSEEEQSSCCASCQEVVKDPVSTSCGHWFCRQCITSYWDQSDSSGDFSCPQCGKRSRTGAGAQTAGQSSTVNVSADVFTSDNRTCCFILFLHTASTFNIVIKAQSFYFLSFFCIWWKRLADSQILCLWHCFLSFSRWWSAGGFRWT